MGIAIESILYDDHTALEDVTALNQLLNVDKQLSLWKSELPKWLRLFFDGDDNLEWNPQHTRQARVISLRYHNSIITLNRPYLLLEMSRLSRGLDILPETALSLVQNSVRACLNSATEIIKLISKASKPEELGAWWYVVHYLHSAAMVLFAGVFFPFQQLAEEEKAFYLHLSQAIEVLQNLSVGNNIVAEYQRSLKRLVNKAQSQRIQTGGVRVTADYCGNGPILFSQVAVAMSPDLQGVASFDQANRDDWLTDLSLDGLFADLPVF